MIHLVIVAASVRSLDSGQLGKAWFILIIDDSLTLLRVFTDRDCLLSLVRSAYVGCS